MLAGTGFLARKHDRLFYVTARHCLTKDHKADIAAFAGKLHVPFSLGGRTNGSDDYVRFAETYSLRHASEDIPGDMVDLVVLSVAPPAKDKQWRQLVSRAVKLPPSGQWLDGFFGQELVQKNIASGRGPGFVIIGYPDSGTGSSITYPDANEPVQINAQPAKIRGFLAGGSYPDRLKLTEVSWEHGLSGFSGSPVFVGFKNENGHQYALAGLAVTGGGAKTEFIKVGLIIHAIGS